MRTHIIEARITASGLVGISGSSSAGGISTSLQLSNTTKQFHRGVLTKTVQGLYIDSTNFTNSTVVIDYQAKIVKENIAADNGLIHEIDQVIDPFLVYGGGPSKRTTAPTREKTNLTISELIQSSPRLVNASKILSANSPDTLRRLSKQYGSKQLFVVPQNEAYDLMPTILPVYRKHQNKFSPIIRNLFQKKY